MILTNCQKILIIFCPSAITLVSVTLLVNNCITQSLKKATKLFSESSSLRDREEFLRMIGERIYKEDTLLNSRNQSFLVGNSFLFTGLSSLNLQNYFLYFFPILISFFWLVIGSKSSIILEVMHYKKHQVMNLNYNSQYINSLKSIENIITIYKVNKSTRYIALVTFIMSLCLPMTFILLWVAKILTIIFPLNHVSCNVPCNVLFICFQTGL